MLQMLEASKGSEVFADQLEEVKQSPESQERGYDRTEIAYGRSYAKNSDKT